MLGMLVLLGLLILASPFVFGHSTALARKTAGGANPTTDNPITIENQNPGTDQWTLGRPGFSVSSDATAQIQGYASATSVNKGQSISFSITVNPAQTYTMDIYRMGWYGGM